MAHVSSRPSYRVQRSNFRSSKYGVSGLGQTIFAKHKNDNAELQKYDCPCGSHSAKFWNALQFDVHYIIPEGCSVSEFNLGN